MAKKPTKVPDKPTIRCRENGPYVIEGLESLHDAEGKPLSTDRGKGNVALCRCGHSKSKPFCDGTHKKTDFRSAKLSDGEWDSRVSCPSGALSHAMDGVEHRDQERPPAIQVTPSGPYYVTGGVELLDAAWGEGASREHYTLCRCGHSKNKPFCDGTHYWVDFADPGLDTTAGE